MSCTQDLPVWRFDLTFLSDEDDYKWLPQWIPSTGVEQLDITVRVQNLVVGGGATVAMKPAIQYAAVRTDRPGAGAVITAGSVITTNSTTHYKEGLSGTDQFFFRPGFSWTLTAGDFARAEVLVYISFRACGKVFPAKEIVFNPTNETAAVSVFPLTGAFSTVGVDVAKLAIVLMNNLNGDMDVRVVGRSFNDPQARGAWEDLGSGWFTPGSGDSTTNTGEIDLSPLDLADFHWMELALAVRKGVDGDPNSRCIFQVIPAIKYT